MSRSSQKFCLFKRSNGYYYLAFADAGKTRWKSTGATTKPDALRVVKNFEALFTPKPKVTTLQTFSTDFLSYAGATFAKRTQIIYRYVFERLKDQLGDCMLSSVTPKTIDDYITRRLAEKISPVTVNIETRALKAAFNTAVRWQLLEHNPFARVKQLHIPERAPEFFTKEQFADLLREVDRLPAEGKKDRRWLKDIILFGAGTGMRQGEILNLRWADVDLVRKLIHIQSNPTFKTKAGKRRTIPLSDVVVALLSARPGKGEYVFMKNGRRILESHLTHEFKAAVRAAELPETLHWHSLRHTHASYLVQAGVPILAVSKLLGHSSVRVTEKHYAALAPESLHEEVNRISLN